MLVLLWVLKLVTQSASLSVKSLVLYSELGWVQGWVPVSELLWGQ
jgi:hypothetical protein